MEVSKERKLRYIKENINTYYDKYGKKRDNSVCRHKAELEDLWERYESVVILFMNELKRRNIDLDETDFEAKMDEILQRIFESKYFKSRFPNENLNDIRNAVLRKINLDKQRKRSLQDKEH